MGKEERRALLRHKFRTYKTGFCIFFALYLLSFVLGAVLWKKGTLTFAEPAANTVLSFYNAGFLQSFRILLLSLFPLFLIFAAGITIYSPLISASSVFFSGAISGMLISFFMSRSRLALSMFEIVFSSVSGYATVIYATLCTLTALRIFTPPEETPQTPEIFTGTLFSSSHFRGIFNFRYALTYILFYILFSLAITLILALRALVVSLV